MKKVIISDVAIVGGDLRILHLAKVYADEGIRVNIYGIERKINHENIVSHFSIRTAIKNSRYVISSIPFTKDNIKIIAPFSKTEILITELLEEMSGKRQSAISW